MGKILVTPKVNPDLDGTSCALAYANFLGDEGVITGQLQSEVQYFIQKHGIKIPTRNDDENGGFENFVLVDASSMKGMPKIVRADKVIEIIDHRKSEPEKEFSHAKIQNELIGAAATIVVERFVQAGRKPLAGHAKLLCGAIYHNTLNFIATNTTDRDRQAVEFLAKNFDLREVLIKEMFDFATQKIRQDFYLAIKDDAKEFGEGHKIRAYQLIMWGGVDDKKPEIEEAVHKIDQELNADWSFLNVVDLDSKKSLIYAGNEVAEENLTRALDCKFSERWVIIPAVLRKQIMPKLAS